MQWIYIIKKLIVKDQNRYDIIRQLMPAYQEKYEIVNIWFK
jgi:hypothetical protein